MGHIVLINIFINYFIAMPIIIITIIKKWDFLTYFKILVFFIVLFNSFFWIIYLLYYTFVKKPKMELEETERLEEIEQAQEQSQEQDDSSSFVLEDEPDKEELIDILNNQDDIKQEQDTENNLDKAILDESALSYENTEEAEDERGNTFEKIDENYSKEVANSQ